MGRTKHLSILRLITVTLGACLQMAITQKTTKLSNMSVFQKVNQSARLRRSLSLISRKLLLLSNLLIAGFVVAMDPPPAVPELELTFPLIDPKPGKPEFSVQFTATGVPSLSWAPVANAEHYKIYAYTSAGSGWQQIATINNGFTHQIDNYYGNGWDLYTMAFKMVACKVRSGWMWWTFWDDTDKYECGDESDVVEIKNIVDAPSIQVTTPASDEYVNSNYVIQWTDRSNVKSNVRLYYDTDNRDHNGTLITQIESNPATDYANYYTWNTADKDSSGNYILESGEYYIYAEIDDGVNTPVYSYSAAKIIINRSPSITITGPNGDVVADTSYDITWLANDPDNQAAITLYYDTDNNGFDGTLIRNTNGTDTNLVEGTHSSYTWNTSLSSTIAVGDYYIYAKIDDGINQPAYAYSSGKVKVNRKPSITLTAPVGDELVDTSYTINWIASDSDNYAGIKLYYDSDNSGYDGTLITGNLVEGTNTSYTWNTSSSSSVSSGDYYIYAVIDDGVHPDPVRVYASGKVKVNRIPAITITAPTIDTVVDTNYSINWEASDSDNQASISLYYDTNNSGNDGILIVAGLAEGSDTSYLWDTSSSSSVTSGDYYIYAVINDGINAAVTSAYSDGKVTINRVPTIAITDPATDALTDNSYTITWAATDPDNDASVSLYYDTDNSGFDGTLIRNANGTDTNLVEGTHTSYTWDTSLSSTIASGDYYIYAVINDGVSPPVVSAYGDGKVTINRVPSIDITAPAVDTVTDDSYTINWTATDPDNNASISLYYDMDNSGNDGTLIADGLGEGSDTSYVWDTSSTSSISSGNYYIYAKIDDGINQPVYDYSSGRIMVDRPPTISVTAPVVDELVDSNYTIRWIANDPDDQASISLYYSRYFEVNTGGEMSGNWFSSSGQSATGSGNPVYQFQVSEAGSVQINLTSSVDNYLYLLNASGNVIAEDDDGGSDVNAQLTTTLDVGTYRIVAATYDASQTDSFLLAITGPVQNLLAVIVDNLVEGTDTSYSWDTSSLASDDYYIRVEIDDGANLPVYADGTGKITVNRPPTIAITAPVNNDLADDNYSITWSSSDPDDGASISLYYDTDNSGNDGTLIVADLAEGSDTSYLWDTSSTSSISSGDYYIYAKIDDGINQPVYTYGTGTVKVNRIPAITITAPTTDTVVDTNYSINWEASDSDNQASISLYYDTNNSGNDGTLIVAGLAEGSDTSYLWDTSSSSSVTSGDYYVYAKIDDGINQPIYQYSSAKVMVNRPPVITMIAPTEDALTDNNYTLTWSASDTDNAANISLYYDTDNSGYDGTLITNILTEGTHSSYLWDTSSSITSGDYYIYAVIDDGVNPAVYSAYATGNVTINRVPAIAITAPATDVLADTSYTITWTANDADNDANISLYYDTDNSGNDGTLITSSLIEGADTSYIWDTSSASSVSSGDYYIYAVIDDGVNPAIYSSYSTGKVTVNRVPAIAITAPATDEMVSASYTISWTASDPDDQAAISLYYNIDNHGQANGSWTSSSGQSYTDTGNPSYQFEVTETGSVQIDLTSSVDNYLYLLDSNGVLIDQNDDSGGDGNGGDGTNAQLIITLDPGLYIVVAATYDTGQVSSFSLSVTGPVERLLTIGGELIVNGLSEGIHSSYNWDTSSLSGGDYYIYAVIDDGVNPAVYSYYAAGKLTINSSPTIAITAPAVDTLAGDSYTISWTASDPDDQASISLYYDDNNSGNDGTLIAEGLLEGTHNSYTWDTSSLANGDYYIYAKIDDGINQPVYAYASGVITADFYIDFSSANNNYNGFYSAPNHSNNHAFATLTADGSITAWGDSRYGGSGAPSDSGYVKIYSTGSAFAALKADGSITAWGSSDHGGSGAPNDSGYVKVYSSWRAFAALKADGSITAWGNTSYGGAGAPSASGYVKIYSTVYAFAAIKADGSIITWGDSDSGGSGAPTDSGYEKIYSTNSAFAAIKADGSITAWGHSDYGGSGAPSDSGYVDIYSTHSAFAAIKADGSIITWGDSDSGGSGVPSDNGYEKIYSTGYAFAALKADGSISAWGNASYGGSGAPADDGYIKIYSTWAAFTALKADGSITAWGNTSYGGGGAPSDSGYVKVYSSWHAFAALKADGSITAWGNTSYGGGGAPSDSGYVKIYSTVYAFAAIKADGSIITWGDSDSGGSGAPSGSRYRFEPLTELNTAPSLTITAPAEDTLVDSSYTISWTASDPDDDASISLYYDTDNTGNDGFLRVDSLTEGTDTSYIETPCFSYAYYQGTWSTIPDFSSLTPVSTGCIREINLYDRPSEEYFAAVYEGPIVIQQQGNYTFYTRSDDGSKLYVNSSLVVDNDGVHGTQERSGTTWLSPGIYQIRVEYFQGCCGRSLEVDYQGADTGDGKQALSSPTGSYYIYAKIDDGVNQPVYAYSNNRVILGQALKLNDTGITWGGSYPDGNNSTCTGETIAQQDCSHGRDAQAAAATLNKAGGGVAGFDFTKLDFNGNSLSASATGHRCVRDNYTGLVWEVKTDDGGIHDKDNTYRWGGITALSYGSGWGDYYSDWDTLINGSNDESLCGFSDWRVPTLIELSSIAHKGTFNPAIDTNYFPNTQSADYWSSSPSAGYSSNAWLVYFYDGYDDYGYRNLSTAVRLVRGGQ